MVSPSSDHPPPINPIVVSRAPQANTERGLLPSEKPNLGQNWGMNGEGGAPLSAGPLLIAIATLPFSEEDWGGQWNSKVGDEE